MHSEARRSAAKCAMAIILAAVVASCSSKIEASHLTGADVSFLGVGVLRSQVLANFGLPAQSYKNANGKTVDFYQLDPNGPSQSTKSTIEDIDIVADIFTLGLAEIVAVPIEYATKHEPTNYVITYSADDRVETVQIGGS